MNWQREAGSGKREAGIAVERVNDLDRVERGLALGERIRRFGGSWLAHFDDCDLDPRACQCAGDYPAVTTVVARTGEHDGAGLELFGISP
jgi:hypothetical protein